MADHIPVTDRQIAFSMAAVLRRKGSPIVDCVPIVARETAIEFQRHVGTVMTLWM
jgi:hypothetical protein